MYHSHGETCVCIKSLVVYSSMLLRVFTTLPQRKKVIMRSKKDETVWDPDEQRRINENKKWKAGDPEEDAWDIDKERDAVRYKRESLESIFKLQSDEEIEILKTMKERIDLWEDESYLEGPTQ